MHSSLSLLFAALFTTTSAAAQAAPDYASMDALPVPVIKAFGPHTDVCEWGANLLRVEPFGTGLLYAVRCASNHANQIYTYVLASDAKGTDATALRFSFPGENKVPLYTLSNATVNSAKREFSHYFINPEEPPCRTQARWRIDGTTPVLVFWREAPDCEGETWVVKR